MNLVFRTNMLMLVENIPRGRLDIPMSVISEHVQKMKGVEKDNLYLQVVGDALKTKDSSVQVMRVQVESAVSELILE